MSRKPAIPYTNETSKVHRQAIVAQNCQHKLAPILTPPLCVCLRDRLQSCRCSLHFSRKQIKSYWQGYSSPSTGQDWQLTMQAWTHGFSAQPRCCPFASCTRVPSKTTPQTSRSTLQTSSLEAVLFVVAVSRKKSGVCLRLSLCVFVCLYVCLYVCLSVCLAVSVCVRLCLHLCVSVSMKSTHAHTSCSGVQICHVPSVHHSGAVLHQNGTARCHTHHIQCPDHIHACERVCI